jgi:hypothetical protein
MGIYKDIEGIFEYLLSIRKLKTYLSIDIELPNTWKIPKKFVSEDKVVEINGGAQSIPVVMFSDGSHLTEPSDPDLRKKLESLGLI